MARLFRIIGAVIWYRLDDMVDEECASRYIRFFLWLLPWRYCIRVKESRSIRLRLCLESLGPIFVKFGQVLSTRRDLLPEDISNELQKLQDQVGPFPTSEAIRIIESSYKKPIAEVFSKFDEEPLASASVAQIYSAYTMENEAVILKIIRPNIKKIILRDIKLMFFCAKVLVFFLPWMRRLRLEEVVKDYKNTILDELDLMREAANGSQLRRNFSDSRLLYVPKIYWELCNPQVMVMERIYGISISDLKQLQDCGVDMKKLAERGVEIFFTQVFRDQFFHADMHPGNIFVEAKDPLDPRYIGVDFGIMGTLEKQDQRYLASNLLAFFRRDYRKVAQLHIDSGWVARDTKVGELETAIRTVCEPIFEKPLKDISFAHLLIRLFQTAGRFDMEVQPQLVLLEKTLLNVEGLGRQIYPDLDLWNTARPFLERWVKDQLRPMRLAKHLRHSSEEWLLGASSITNRLMMNLSTYVEQKHDDDALKKELKREELLFNIAGFGLLLIGTRIFLANDMAPWIGGCVIVLGGIILFGNKK